MSKLRVEEAHDHAVATMNDQAFKLHQTDCAICEDFGRPVKPTVPSKAEPR